MGVGIYIHSPSPKNASLLWNHRRYGTSLSFLSLLTAESALKSFLAGGVGGALGTCVVWYGIIPPYQPMRTCGP